VRWIWSSPLIDIKATECAWVTTWHCLQLQYVALAPSCNETAETTTSFLPCVSSRATKRSGLYSSNFLPVRVSSTQAASFHDPLCYKEHIRCFRCTLCSHYRTSYTLLTYCDSTPETVVTSYEQWIATQRFKAMPPVTKTHCYIRRNRAVARSET
jgi:hypothetical protein